MSFNSAMRLVILAAIGGIGAWLAGGSSGGIILGLGLGLSAWWGWEHQRRAHLLHQKLNEKNHYIATIEHQLETHHHAQTTWQAQLIDAQAQQQHWRDRCQTLETQVAAQQLSIESLQHTIAQQAAEQQRHQQTLIERHQQRIQTLRQQIIDKDIDQVNTTEYVTLLEAEIAALNTQQLEAQEEWQQAQQQLEDANQRVQTLEAATSQLEEQLRQANRKLNDKLLDRPGSSPSSSPNPGSLATTAPEDLYYLHICNSSDLLDLQPKDLVRVLEKLMKLQTNPRPQGCDSIKKYRRDFPNLLRIRAGDHRIVYTVEASPIRHICVVMVAGRDERLYDERLGRRLYGQSVACNSQKAV